MGLCLEKKIKNWPEAGMQGVLGQIVVLIVTMGKKAE